MIPASAVLRAFLASANEFFVADLYTFNLANGAVLRFNSSDIDLSFGGNTWLGSALTMERGKIKTVIGVQVDELQVTIYSRPSDLVGADPFVQLALNGGLDGCYLQLDRAFSPGPGQAITGIVPKRFYGRIAEIKGGRSKLVLTIKSDLDLLNIEMPRVLFQAPCSHSLYDAGCTLLKFAFTVSGTVGTVGSKSAINTSLTQADGYFTLGVLTFTSGVNTGLSRTVKMYANASGAIQFILPLPALPATGDTFSVYPGCDKTFATCGAKFDNSNNYRGFEYVPNPETSLI